MALSGGENSSARERRGRDENRLVRLREVIRPRGEGHHQGACAVKVGSIQSFSPEGDKR